MKRLLLGLGLLTLTGCSSTSYYLVSSEFVASSQGQQPPEIIVTDAYRADAGATTTVAVRAPDSCANKTADEATGGAQSKGSILLTNCGVEMAEIEKALARSNYRVISWKVLAKELSNNKSATEVASSLGAEVLFQINSLEKSQKTLGKDARWERKYFQSNENGERLADQPFVDSTREFIKQRFLSGIENKYSARTMAVTLDATAVWVKSGQSIWYYRWTHAAEPSKVGSRYALLLSCIDNNIYACGASWPRTAQAQQASTLTSGESEAVSVSEKAEDAERALYADLLKEVIGSFVQSFAQSRNFAPAVKPAPAPAASEAPANAPVSTPVPVESTVTPISAS